MKSTLVIIILLSTVFVHGEEKMRSLKVSLRDNPALQAVVIRTEGFRPIEKEFKISREKCRGYLNSIFVPPLFRQMKDDKQELFEKPSKPKRLDNHHQRMILQGFIEVERQLQDLPVAVGSCPAKDLKRIKSNSGKLRRLRDKHFHLSLVLHRTPKILPETKPEITQ